MCYRREESEMSEEKIKITIEQVKEYIEDNFSAFFVEALAKYVKDVICPNATTTQEEMQEYRNELKFLIRDGICDGVKEYLREYEGEAVEIIANQFLKQFSDKEISINFK